MAKNDGRGSILLKLLIVVLAIVLIAVVTIPANIWEEEAHELNLARNNLSSIYEAEAFYHRLNNSFTADPAELLRVVRDDSSLVKKQQVVNYTRDLANTLDSYKNIPFVKAVLTLNENVEHIREDLETNKHYIRPYEDIANEAQNLEIQLAGFNSSTEAPNYVRVGAYLDSLTTLRRDMSDFSLQTCASKAKVIVDTLNKLLPRVEVSTIGSAWNPISGQVSAFAKTVLNSPLVNVTSVGDRIRDFRAFADDAVKKIQTIDKNADIAKANKLTEKVNGFYDAFLADFLVTSKRALYKLSEADSMVLHLTEDNFYCPASGEQIKIIISPDSGAVTVESPVLLNEMHTRLKPVAESVRSLPAMAAIKAYNDSLQMIVAKSYTIRKKLRKNTDIFIAYKEIEEISKRFAEIGIMTAYQGLNTLVQLSDSCESYHQLQTATEDGLNGIRIFNQAYSENTFGKLESLNNDIVLSMSQFDSLLSKVRRLPKSIVPLDQDIVNLNQALARIKSAKSDNFAEIEKSLGDLYLFASEGTTTPRYGVFEKKVKNFGYISQGTKSWEK